jgi:hypothetical protein
MPGHYRVGLDENESFGPVVPNTPNDNPEQPIELTVVPVKPKRQVINNLPGLVTEC